jgi:GNAT superfamily N-acetyltransferase
MRFLGFAAYDADTMVGAARLDLSVYDNLHVASLVLYVDPDRQRRGVGRALEAHCASRARAEGRRLMMAEAFAPTDEESAGTRFARALGYSAGIEDGIKVVDLDETEPTWAALEAKASARRGDYRLVTWQDHVPDALVADYCRLNEMFFDEAPTGDLEIENEVWDARRVAEREKRNLLTGRHELGAGALAPDGTMVGVTEIVVNERAPHRGFQSGTLVVPEHRGHALGLALKLANHRQLREVFPQCAVVMTGNAGVNAPMNAVNEQLGYREIERCVELQKDVST